MDPNTKLLPDQGELLEEPKQYRRLVGKLNYLTITRPVIAFAVSVISQFMSSPRTTHWDAVVRILRYLKGALGRGFMYKLIVTVMLGLDPLVIGDPLLGNVFSLVVILCHGKVRSR